jgi:hypothetical protein
MRAAPSRACTSASGALLARWGGRLTPRLEAADDVVLVGVLNLGDLRQVERIARVTGLQTGEQLDGAAGLPLVPQIDDVQLEIGLALEQAAAAPRPQHLAQPLLAVAAGEQQQEAQEPRRRRRYVGVVLVHAEAEVGVVQARLEGDGSLHRFFDLLAVTRRGELFAAQHPPLHARAEGPAQVEPGFRVLRRPLRPRFRGADRALDRGTERVVQRPVLRVELDPPPQRRRFEHVAGFRRRRAAGATQLRVDLIESCFEDELVGAYEAVFAAKGVARRQRRDRAAGRLRDRGSGWRRALGRRVGECGDATERDQGGEPRHPARSAHVRLVRSCCLFA